MARLWASVALQRVDAEMVVVRVVLADAEASPLRRAFIVRGLARPIDSLRR